MKRMGNLLAAVILAVFAYGIYRLPSMMMGAVEETHTGGAAGDLLAVETQEENPASRSGALPVSTGGASASTTVTVTVDYVNIRGESGASTGEYARRGDVLGVYWLPDGWGVIVSPAYWRGNMIWRGCTSDAGNKGCEAK